MKLEELDAVSFSRDGFKPHVKSPIIWGHKGNEIFPLCYITKPKYISEEDFNNFLNGFTFEIKVKR